MGGHEILGQLVGNGLRLGDPLHGQTSPRARIEVIECPECPPGRRYAVEARDLVAANARHRSGRVPRVTVCHVA